ncbi:F0F1 ATP synthase subunit B family protein [Nitrosospira briensis]|uniref:ATP synthase subunit b n=1 Tax=Nitrosospira briensis TaxID=35799 RepID=A0A1I4XWG5_9PROT|nr:F0F1 ATP synthase subunit B [Nitrosospira briensis]SFN30115.1 F-type H+-transporting ATPase subunit b [Nitrosospira briensis]SFN65925.1 ATP synthase F0 subcomplex B subunit [Nitrosospira briensis]
MLIDWFTVIAQVVNFLILVWLLKRFFYQPILNALDARERRIATELADAEAKKLEAEKERDEFQHKNNEFDQQRLLLLSKASNEAQAERQRLMAAARTDLDNLRAKRERALEREYRSLSEALVRQTCAEVFAIARKVLADLAGTTLEAHIVEAFIKRLHESSDEEKAGLASAFRSKSVLAPAAAAASAASAASRAASTAAATGGELMVNSAFDLPAAQQDAIEAALEESLGIRLPVRFATRSDLVSGVELVAGGYKVAWSIAAHLASLEKEVWELLENQSGHEFEAESETEPELPHKHGT